MPARILVIEDNPANLELMQYLLQAFGYVTLSASDGVEGLATARREHPDLIVCDIQLPKLDGFGVVRQIKVESALSRIPLVAVSALAMVGDRDKILTAGFDGYIAKPIAPETFVSQVAGFLRPALRSEPQALPHATPGIAAPAPRAEGARILAVDNAAVNLSLIVNSLVPFGYQVETAQSVTQALAAARTTRPDLILTDVHMPGGTGFDLIDAVQSDPQLRDVPIILISSTMQSDLDRRHAQTVGATRFITGPLEPQMLLAEIEACLAKTKAK